MQVSGVNPGDNLKDAGRGVGAGRAERRFRGMLVAAEIAISLVLLVGAGLLVRSFWSMLQVNPGLDPARCRLRPDLDSCAERSIEESVRHAGAAQRVHQRGAAPCPRAARRRVGRDERQQPDPLQRVGRDAALYIRRRIDSARRRPARAVPGRQPGLFRDAEVADPQRPCVHCRRHDRH